MPKFTGQIPNRNTRVVYGLRVYFSQRTTIFTLKVNNNSTVISTDAVAAETGKKGKTVVMYSDKIVQNSNIY